MLRLTRHHVAVLETPRHSFTLMEINSDCISVNIFIFSIFEISSPFRLPPFPIPSHLNLFSPRIKTHHHDVSAVDRFDFVFAVIFHSFVFFCFSTC